MNDLDKLIAKFCAPNEESDRPRQVITASTAKQIGTRSENMVKRCLAAITEAEETAIANGEPLASKTQILSEVGVSTGVLPQHPELLAAYERAQKRCMNALQPAPDKSTIALTVEVSEAVYDGLRRYLERNTDWDSDRVAESALALFLLQNRAEQGENRELSRIYLDSVFRSTAA